MKRRHATQRSLDWKSRPIEQVYSGKDKLVQGERGTNWRRKLGYTSPKVRERVIAKVRDEVN
jgi:hypothetical protein